MTRPHITLRVKYRVGHLFGLVVFLGLLALGLTGCYRTGFNGPLPCRLLLGFDLLALAGLTAYQLLLMRCPRCHHRLWATGPKRWRWYGWLPPEHCAFCGEKLERQLITLS